MSVEHELEQLLHERFEITPAAFVAALRHRPASRPSAATLTETEAHLLDDPDFTDDREPFVAAGAETAAHTAHLAVTAFTAAEGPPPDWASAPHARQKRVAGERTSAAGPRHQQFRLVADSGRRHLRTLDRTPLDHPALGPSNQRGVPRPR